MIINSNLTDTLNEMKKDGMFSGRFMFNDIVNQVKAVTSFRHKKSQLFDMLITFYLTVRTRSFLNHNNCLSVGDGEYVNILSDAVTEDDIEYITKMNNKQIKARQKRKRMFKELEGQMVAKFDPDNNFAGYDEEHKVVNQ